MKDRSTPSRSTWRAALQAVLRLVVMSVAIAVAGPLYGAQDAASLRKDLETATDTRIRVTAALALGKLKDKASVDALSRALGHEAASVRAAAAAALGAIGEKRAVAALERAKESEKDATVKKAMERALTQLKGRAKLVVAVGKLENKSGNPKMSTTFTSAAKAELAKIPGVQVANNDNEAVETAKSLKLPTIAVDGKLVHLQKEKAGGEVGFQARVEFVIRKLPEQSLKASVKGNAKALLNAKAVKGDADLSALQVEAVNAAVQSAFSGAPKAMEEAAK